MSSFAFHERVWHYADYFSTGCKRPISQRTHEPYSAATINNHHPLACKEPPHFACGCYIGRPNSRVCCAVNTDALHAAEANAKRIAKADAQANADMLTASSHAIGASRSITARRLTAPHSTMAASAGPA